MPTLSPKAGEKDGAPNVSTPSKMPAAVVLQSFRYGESCQTVPLPYLPQSAVVP